MPDDIVRFLTKSGVSPADFRKNSPVSNVAKIRPVGAALIHADRQTDRQTGGQRHDEANERFSPFLRNASNKEQIIVILHGLAVTISSLRTCFTFFLYSTTPLPFQLTFDTLLPPPPSTEFSCQKLASNCIQPRP